ncbi:MAG: hypothetical protein L7F77_14265 [Candidatus Magnetominusculus sp. LBB02]|nr:hypothetical protein [Candidatus Magnetominusculus sp. LBB02]
MALTYDIETDILYRQGLERGIEKGLARGIERGIEKGLERGIEKGLERGIEDGRTEGRLQGLKQGLTEAIELAVELKFGVQSLTLIEGIKSINDVNKLEQIKELVRRASSIDEVITELGS